MSDDTHGAMTMERLEVAFGLDVLRRVAAADGTEDVAEWEAIRRAWPDRVLRQHGFLDQDGLTRSWAEAAAEARGVLPDRLPKARKLLLLGFFHSVAMADGELHPREVQEIHMAATALGVSVAELGAHLDAITGVSGDAPPRRR